MTLPDWLNRMRSLRNVVSGDDAVVSIFHQRESDFDELLADNQAVIVRDNVDGRRSFLLRDALRLDVKVRRRNHDLVRIGRELAVRDEVQVNVLLHLPAGDDRHRHPAPDHVRRVFVVEYADKTIYAFHAMYPKRTSSTSIEASMIQR